VFRQQELNRHAAAAPQLAVPLLPRLPRPLLGLLVLGLLRHQWRRAH
jgi:hypothetical protein